MKKRAKSFINGIKVEVMECPVCAEELKPGDLEVYPYCPYCNTVLSREGKVEDFILSPVVRQWVSKQLGRD